LVQNLNFKLLFKNGRSPASLFRPTDRSNSVIYFSRKRAKVQEQLGT